ncbi:MAG: 4a-hydroxytetrahydrobiopterin dehydratase [Euryarchaeota archaeon]|nr:4a-hydroxytetrahydrobiopterin dehydratase [Euryarchaeota archaeon]
MTLLADSRIRRELRRLPEWKKKGRALVRRLEHRNFLQAMRNVNKIAKLAEEKQHHPDFAIHWNIVTLKLWSHDMGGITERDVRMARAINRLLPP